MKFLNRGSMSLFLKCVLAGISLCISSYADAEMANPMEIVAADYERQNYASARRAALRYAEINLDSLQRKNKSFVADLSQAQRLDLLRWMRGFTKSICIPLSFERKLTQSAADEKEASLEFANKMIKKLERSDLIAEQRNLYHKNSTGYENGLIQETLTNKAIAIRDYCVLLPERQKRNQVINDHRKLLEEHGINLSKLEKGQRAELTDKKIGKKDTEFPKPSSKEVKKIIRKFYNALGNQNRAALRQVISKKQGKEVIARLFRELESEKREENFQIIDYTLDDAEVNFNGKKDGRIRITVEGIKGVIQKDGEEITLRESKVFYFVQEGDSWALWSTW